jgi:hypothetical protein
MGITPVVKKMILEVRRSTAFPIRPRCLAPIQQKYGNSSGKVNSTPGKRGLTANDLSSPEKVSTALNTGPNRAGAAERS